MEDMKTSFIATVLNEEKTIDRFLESIRIQSVKPDEIIITDGGSRDRTVEKIDAFQKKHSLPLLVLIKKGNRSIGRNTAIKKAKGEIILCSDAGCTLDKDWVRNILKPFKDQTIDVVAGYYQGVAKNLFQKCLIPYVLVMPDQIDAKNFLPATRSMAFRKTIWGKAGMFPEQFAHNEDYVFAKKLSQLQKKIIFVKTAIVYWYPPETWKNAYVMFYRFAKGDAQARIYRPKVVLIFARYILCLLVLALYFMYHHSFLLFTFYFLLFLYIVWSIYKNYAYVKNSNAIYILPMLQFLSDGAVLIGTVEGMLNLF